MSKKKIEPTVAMILDAASTGTPLGTDARAILRAALNHPDAAGLFADDDATRAAREEGWDQATRWIDSYQGGPNGRTTSARSANPHRPVQELPRKKGTVIIPADGHEHVEATCFGIVWRASEAVLDPDGRWLGVWRRGAGGAAVGSVSPGRITPGTWKVEGE